MSGKTCPKCGQETRFDALCCPNCGCERSSWIPDDDGIYRCSLGTWNDKPLTWRALDHKGNRVLLIAEEIVCSRPYDSASDKSQLYDNYYWELAGMHAYEPDTTNPIPVISNSDVKPVTWEECDLRHWLNGEFIASAFNEVEQTRVCETAVKNPPNPWYGASGGNTTRDKAFCISITESSYLLGPDAQRWAHSQEQWWLRSPGGRDGISAATADADEIFFFGDFVGHDHGVRPLIWATWNGEALAIRHPQSLDFTTKGSFLKGCRIKRGKEYACVPRGITTIGDLAFADSFFLRFAYLPEGVISIGDLAFYGCEWLEAIWLPNSLVSIGEEAFRGCKRMKSIVIPENVMDISYEAFARCTFLTEFEIKGDLRRVAMWPDDVFDNTPCEERYKQLHEKAQWAALNALFNKE